MFSSVMLMKSMFTLFISSVLHYSPLCHVPVRLFFRVSWERVTRDPSTRVRKGEVLLRKKTLHETDLKPHDRDTAQSNKQASVLDASCQHRRSSRATLWERSSGPGSCFSWQLLPVNHRCVCVCVRTRACSFLVWETSATFSAVQISLNLQAVRLRRGVMIFKKIYIFLWIKI